ncbi:hypothetical protein OS189_17170 [Sulfitobacter sp. F26169L]|uniref:hypothetical protein n=1 Tax=Sulfitobacter sp. F26169L TaxID=2996015 RepID=UPI002260A403|nr:hypothetical protein [Sulfitobacter sp. F26169L]MCX7568076.1 hypothetical protein [Sulfitobacter sp. F26169L]
MTVARADGPLTYQELADLVGQPYVTLAHQIAALSDGRDRSPGLGLLSRQQGRHTRARVVTCSDVGLSDIQPFIVQQDQSPYNEATAADILSRTLSALDAVLERYPKLTLGSLCVYLFIATHQEKFAYFGEPVKIISRGLELSNLPKHLKVLEIGATKSPSTGLIGFHTNEYDQRIRLPFLTQAGIALECALVTALTGKETVAPKVPRAEALDALDSPTDVPTLEPEDFDDIVWE